MKKVIGIIVLVLLAGSSAFAQLSKEESSKMTHDQRVLHESDRKSKHGKKNLSMKKKVKIDKKESRKAKRIKQPKRKG